MWYNEVVSITNYIKMLAIYEVLVLCSMKNDHGTGEGDVERHCHNCTSCTSPSTCALLQTICSFSQRNQAVVGHMHVNSLWSPVCNTLNSEGLFVKYCKRTLGFQSNSNGDNVAARKLLPPPNRKKRIDKK